MTIKQIADSIEYCFSSPNTLDSNFENANIVDVIHSLSNSVRAVSTAITPDAMPGIDAAGGHVRSLTEAVMGVTAGLIRIADAIDNLSSRSAG